MTEPITEMPAFKACVADNKLIEVALFDVVDAIVRTMINRRPTGDVLTSPNFLREQLEKGPSQ
jgi:hypothetical protein